MVRFTLNGKPVAVADVDPHVTLLQWLRSQGLSGSKEGCAEGECGACAVALLRRDEHGRARLEAVNSCLLPLPSVADRSVITVEGVADPDGALHPVQRALVESGGSQCGYCTPGFVVSLFCEYYRPDRSGYNPEAISGNLCRCTGYRPIADAARALPQPLGSDPRLPILRAEVPSLGALRYEAGEHGYMRPRSLAELFGQWQARPEALPIAGGTDLMVYANQRGRRWPALLALDALAELKLFAVSDRELSIGAGIELAELERRFAGAHYAPALEQLWPLFSSRLIRNRATLGGSLATASPIGDAAPVLLALDAELTLVSQAGARRVPLRDFFTGYRSTVLAPQELIQSVHVPLPTPPVQRFYKVSKRVLDDISTVAAAFALELDAERRVTRIALAYGGVAATPLRALGAEVLALGQPWNRDTVARMQEVLQTFGTPQDDHRGRARYRRAMIARLLDKFFHDTTEAP